MSGSDRWRTLTLAFLALGLAVSDFGGAQVSADCSRNSDGCTTLGIYEEYRSLFTPSCHRHDACYACGASKGLSRLDCDNAFLTDLNTACGAAGMRRRKRDTCRVAVLKYYGGVRLAGWIFFRPSSRPASHCQEPWVRGCLPTSGR